MKLSVTETPELNGNPNDYGSKLIYIFMPLGLYLLMLVLPFIDPRRANYEIFSETYYKLRIILGLFFSLFANSMKAGFLFTSSLITSPPGARWLSTIANSRAMFS